ncbi:MAG: DUF418 domain-containing protein [Planctomycetota bacterium]
MPERERIAALDLLRGFAILGIFCVNIQFFARPISDYFGPIGGDAATSGEVIAWTAIKALCEYKFITLFSFLFGIGLTVQLARAKAAGGGFVAMYLRRLLVLAAFGLVHAIGFWYGDILFMYACFGLILLALSGVSARAQLITGACLIVAVAVVTLAFGAMQVVASSMFQPTPAPALVEQPANAAPAADVAAASDETPGRATDTAASPPDAAPPVADPAPPPPISDAELLRTSPLEAPARVLLGDPESVFGERWRNLEIQAYREGPLASAVAMRVVSFGMMLASAAFSFGWRILGVFLIGAGLMKLDFFSSARRRWHLTMLVVGLPVGLLLEFPAATLLRGSMPGTTWTWLLGEQMHYVGSLFLCAGFAGGITLLASRRSLTMLERGVAAVGRMALTNYLLQTLIATFTMYWWGLDRFDSFSRPQMLAFVVGVYALQIVLSMGWLAVFRMGPMEWLWRSLTYLRPQSILRRRELPGPKPVS